METVTEKPPMKKLKRLFINLAKLSLDVTKLSFGSLVLGSIIKGDFSQSSLLIAGIIVSVFLATFEIVVLTIFEEK